MMSDWLSLQLDRVVVDLGDARRPRALPLVASIERAHAAGHRIACGGLVAPAVEVVDHVVGVEVVAVRPFHALADMQGVFGGVVADLPALDQMARRT